MKLTLHSVVSHAQSSSEMKALPPFLEECRSLKPSSSDGTDLWLTSLEACLDFDFIDLEHLDPTSERRRVSEILFKRRFRTAAQA